MHITEVRARQILDSRGNPTVETDLRSEKYLVQAAVPSGASTGIHEARELRDGNKRKYFGKGVTKAIDNINTKIAKRIISHELNPYAFQRFVDQAMIALDKTKNKAKLGANAILGVSMASARLIAKEKGVPLFHSLREEFEHTHIQSNDEKTKYTLPVPFANVINGGQHADNGLALQEFMMVPKAKSFAEATRMLSETFHVLKEKIAAKYGKAATNYGDEGGFAPNIESSHQALDLITEAIGSAGYRKKIKIAIDAAASEFYEKDGYRLGPYNKMDAHKLMDYYHDLIKAYPIISLEDPFDQDDFESYSTLRKKVHIQIVGDDLLVTNPTRIKLAAEGGLCNALLLKVNQIGTITEALEAAHLSFSNDWKVMVSHRSGETEDPFIADLAVALGCGQIKLGAPNRTDRTAKYNQLLRIEEQLGKQGKLAQIF